MAGAGHDEPKPGRSKKSAIAVTIASEPEAFDCGEKPPDGGPGWEIAGEVYTTNPALDLDPAWWDVVRLWRAYKGGGYSIGYLPDAGGMNDQAAWLVDIFGYMSTTEAKLKPE